MGKKFLLPLLASLGLAASVAVPAVVASVSQRDEIAESVLNYNPKVRQNRFDTKLVSDSQDFSDPYMAYVYVVSDNSPYLDAYISCKLYDSTPVLNWSNGYFVAMYVYNDDGDYYPRISIALDSEISDYLWLNNIYFGYGASVGSSIYFSDGSQPSYYWCSFDYPSAFESYDDAYNWLEVLDGKNNLFLFASDVDSYDEYMQSHQVVSGIEAGLPLVGNAAQALVGGFDSMALNNGALTNVMAFSFTLLGLGCAVGICKKVFSWITGRHGM